MGVFKQFNKSLLVAAIALTPFVQADEMSNEAIKERLKPVGSVHIAGAQPVAASGGARSGEDVYNASCTACHSAGVLNAPKPHTEDWKPRLEKGLDTLLEHAINGFNAMPPKGTCMDCSDDELKAAIEFMLEGV
ncbi:cytochrome c5 family protein [Catenovulum sp. 2E275]|uniref:c-type cytochrome n=1 Tax=Catenovulum sp. 2E275 TaxID=2980497 RepID=UPI0021D0E369|nr:cytochrome c5 family protein [Catenovulum sp. 2E275]MCU4675519.1 cytochrome c5 family protein [Catenovulum sp. 2E275]